MRRTTQHRGLQRAYLGILGGATLIAVLGAAFAATLAGTSAAATTVAPNNVTEPQITGEPRVGQVQRATRGTWTGTSPITYEYRWFRCDGAGQPDASDCQRITNASDNTYVARQGDAGFRLRVQVLGRNADGQDTATSNPTAEITSAGPNNKTEPSITGTATVGSTLQANRGEWSGQQPITYTYAWQRCNAQGDNCSEIQGANDTEYEVRDADSGRTIRVRVTARNDRGQTSAISNPTGVVGGGQTPPPAPGNSVPVGDLRAAGDRLVVASVGFNPNPVTSRTAPITVRVKITARGGRPVSGARVFMRATPRVVSGQTQTTGADGFVTLTLIPNQAFPQPRSGFNVQFFIKASRPGDPGLGGIAGYRLVQVRLAG
ncbi:MAG: Ig-like domain-containing protein [Actinomycetota bacterium]|nr:Ig-like domain-containing protein [Actinomycetota bacterium]